MSKVLLLPPHVVTSITPGTDLSRRSRIQSWMVLRSVTLKPGGPTTR